MGQSGNQIGMRFWDLLLQEHSQHNSKGIYDSALSTFFKNVDNRGQEWKLGTGSQSIQGLQARVKNFIILPARYRLPDPR